MIDQSCFFDPGVEEGRGVGAYLLVASQNTAKRILTRKNRLRYNRERALQNLGYELSMKVQEKDF